MTTLDLLNYEYYNKSLEGENYYFETDLWCLIICKLYNSDFNKGISNKKYEIVTYTADVSKWSYY